MLRCVPQTWLDEVRLGWIRLGEVGLDEVRLCSPNRARLGHVTLQIRLDKIR